MLWNNAISPKKTFKITIFKGKKITTKACINQQIAKPETVVSRVKPGVDTFNHILFPDKHFKPSLEEQKDNYVCVSF